jgi:hydroxymethylpyrimidine/phosphomethylpyrimidine kinase
MVAKGGASLLDPDAVAILLARLMPRAAIVTPNVPEAEALTGLHITDPAGLLAAAASLRRMGAGAVLLKGGHLEGDTVVDLLLTEHGVTRLEAPRLITQHTHGTGCTLASAIATGLAAGMPLLDAVRRAHAYVRAAIAAAPGLGVGHGPLGHGAARVA